MPQRVSTQLDDELASILRKVQAKRIRETGHSVSFSSLLNELIRDGLKEKIFNT